MNPMGHADSSGSIVFCLDEAGRKDIIHFERPFRLPQKTESMNMAWIYF